MAGSRQTMLRRLRLALGDLGRPGPEAERPGPEAAVRPGDWPTFAQALARLGVSCDLAADLDEARRLVAAYLTGEGISRLARWDHPLLEALGLDALARGLGIEVLPPADGRDAACRRLALADLGVTAADAAVAATGTVVLAAGPGRERGVSLLPPRHLAVVPLGALVAALPDLARLYRKWAAAPDGGPSAVHCVSGPSGTGDIEFVLVRGAHGPLSVRVIGLDDREAVPSPR